MQKSKAYKLDMSSPLNEPWNKFVPGGHGRHEGLTENDRYVISTQVIPKDEAADGPPLYVFLNITTGRVVAGAHPLERFVEA